jgi:hypothetical protein
MKFQSLQKAQNKPRTGAFAIMITLLLGGCIQDADFEKLKLNKVDGWTYISTSSPEGHTNSTSASVFPKDENGNLAFAAFECHNNSNLHLIIETFRGNINHANPMKMRYAKSAFGRFTVIDIKATNHQNKFTIVAQGSNENTAAITLHPGEAKLGQKLISPNLMLTLPTDYLPTDIAISLDNSNIKKVFDDCGFKPAFMMSN